MYKHKKLSTIWLAASKELEQVENQFGNLYKKQACAMGAICYYLSEGESVTPFILTMKQAEWYEKHLQAFCEKTGKSAGTWNDWDHKTFRELAEMARKVGM